MNATDTPHPLSSTLRQVTAGVDAASVAHAVVIAWQTIATELGPLIGPRGVAALYQHSLQRAAQMHPWLAGTLDGERTHMNLAALEQVLAAQTLADAASAGQTVLQIFCDLLAALVGASLTERLMRPVWAAHLMPVAPGSPP